MVIVDGLALIGSPHVHSRCAELNRESALAVGENAPVGSLDTSS